MEHKRYQDIIQQYVTLHPLSKRSKKVERGYSLFPLHKDNKTILCDVIHKTTDVICDSCGDVKKSNSPTLWKWDRENRKWNSKCKCPKDAWKRI